MRTLPILYSILIFLFFKTHAQDIKRAKQHIDTLCSVKYAGRGYVDEGDKKAAEFISTEFTKIGLQSFEDNFYQSFQFPINTFPNEVILKIGKKSLRIGDDFIMEASSPSVFGKAKLHKLDTLIFSDSTASRKFLKVSCKNTMLIYRQKDYKKITKLPSKYLEKFYCFDQYLELQDKKLTASVSPLQSEKATFQILENSLPKKAKNAAFEVEAKLIEQYNSQNVIGYIPGSSHPDSLIVITAHYDHLGKMGDIYFPGANDNASGVSMMMELAHYYKEKQVYSKYTIVFIAFTAEEAGLIGSHFFVENPLFPLNKIKFLINLDLVGTGDDGITVVNGSIYNKEFEALTSINSNKNYFNTIKKRGEAANSDHYFFHKKGVRSFFIYTLGGTTAYHDIYDVPSSLTFSGYSKLFDLLTEFIEKL
jgi:aminopeptidase YwaD